MFDDTGVTYIYGRYDYQILSNNKIVKNSSTKIGKNQKQINKRRKKNKNKKTQNNGKK